MTVAGPGGPQTLTTDAQGGFYLGDLLPGTYTITVTAPDGTDVVGAGSRTVTITAAGEIVGGQDFVIANAPTPPAPTDPDPDPGTVATPGAGGPGPVSASSGRLPDVGGPSSVWGLAGVGLLVAGLALLMVSSRRPGSLRRTS